MDIQRILNHYDCSKIGDYIRHQLSYSGTQSDIFTEKAIDSIFSYSSGIARMIDKTCKNVLIYVSQNRLRLIDNNAMNVVLECELS